MKEFLIEALEDINQDFSYYGITPLQINETLINETEIVFAESPITTIYFGTDKKALKEIISMLCACDYALDNLNKNNNTEKTCAYWIIKKFDGAIAELYKLPNIFNDYEILKKLVLKNKRNGILYCKIGTPVFGSKIIKSDCIELRECPSCGNKSLAIFEAGGSHLSNSHSISSICLDCIEIKFGESNLELWRTLKEKARTQPNCAFISLKHNIVPL